jgi:hypothetical protein
MAGVLLVAAGSGQAQLLPLGEETLINTETTGRQAAPAVAVDADGNHVVVWEGDADPLLAGRAVRGRKFDAFGNAQGTEFLIGTVAHGNAYPDVAIAQDGGFVVVWRDYDDDSYPRIAARAFDSQGSPHGEATFVDAEPVVFTGVAYAGAPAVAAGTGGEFVVAWSGGERNYSYFGFSRYFEIRGRRLDPQGAPQAEQVVLGGDGGRWTTRPDIAEKAPGEFVVVWSQVGHYEYGYDDGEYVRTAIFEVRGRLVDATGAPRTGEFAVGDDGFRGPAVSADAAGHFRVVWPRADENSSYEIALRRYDADANALGESVAVNDSATSGSPGPPNAGKFGTALSSAKDGSFVVVWAEGGESAPGAADGTALEIHARAFGIDGTALDSESIVNAPVVDSQHAPAIAHTTQRDLVVAWQAENGDGSNSAIAARRLLRAADCGDVTADARTTATDALFVLNAAVATSACNLCVCDVDASGSITATDALTVLTAAVGGEAELNCPVCS